MDVQITSNPDSMLSNHRYHETTDWEHRNVVKRTLVKNLGLRGYVFVFVYYFIE